MAYMLEGLTNTDAVSHSPYSCNGKHIGKVLLTLVTVPSAKLETLKWASPSSVFSFLEVGPSSHLEKKEMGLPLKTK